MMIFLSHNNLTLSTTAHLPPPPHPPTSTPPSSAPSIYAPPELEDESKIEDRSELEKKDTSFVSSSRKPKSTNSPSTATGADEFRHQLHQALGVNGDDNTMVFALGGNSLMCKMFVDFEVGGKSIRCMFCWLGSLGET